MDTATVQESVQNRFPISVEMYHLMGEKGVFHPEDRVELIEGELFKMSPIGNLHSRCVKFLANYLITLLSGKFVVGFQDPIVLNDASEPQPDVSILNFRADFYKDETPHAKDVLLVIEVAETSVSFDKNLKFHRYASAGIPEAWLIDLVAERVEVHTMPEENGYSVIKTYQRGKNAVSESIPSIDLSVDDILG